MTFPEVGLPTRTTGRSDICVFHLGARHWASSELFDLVILISLFKKEYLFIYLVMLGLHCPVAFL